jgi:alpha-L-rhamnosidase
MRVKLNGGAEYVLGSDESWLWKPSPVIFSNIYDGEIYDSNINDATIHSEPGAVRLYNPPVGELRARLSLPVVIKKE